MLPKYCGSAAQIQRAEGGEVTVEAELGQAEQNSTAAGIAVAQRAEHPVLTKPLTTA